MRSCCGALSLLTTALGGYLSAFLMAAVTSSTHWLDDLDNPATARLDLYFYLLAGFMLAATLVFVGISTRYQYKTVRHRAPLPLIGGQQSHAVMQQLPPGARAISSFRPIHGTRVICLLRRRRAAVPPQLVFRRVNCAYLFLFW